MGTLILRLKSWQAFLIFFIAAITSSFTFANNPLLTTIINVIGFSIYFLWFFAVGIELSNRAKVDIRKSKNMFYFNGLILMISITIVQFLYGGDFESSGFVGFLWSAYCIYALFQFFSFPLKVLRSIELNREAKIGSYLGYFILMAFWPIGIWGIQMKINFIEKNYPLEN